VNRLSDRVQLAPNLPVDHIDAGPAAEVPKGELLPSMGAVGDERTDRWREERPVVVGRAGRAAAPIRAGKGAPA
jgi:hypothetical protein